MKTGIELITEERKEQIEKHHISIQDDVLYNTKGQLSVAAEFLVQKDIPERMNGSLIPKGWNEELWRRMVNKPYRERLIIAGALIAAEIDRLQSSFHPTQKG